jgi:NAD(P)-dependent dehydrogenase (short-subunit alcohol dehydrogenase family)
VSDPAAPFSVTGKRVLITGGTAGIGLGVAQHLSEAGADVVIAGRRSSGEEIATELGGKFVKMDVSDAQSVAEGVAVAADMLGGAIDVLILNAGIGPATGPIRELDVAQVRATFEVNVFGVIYGLKEALPYMGPGGSVIITSSPAGTICTAGMTGYGASKTAVNTLTRVWAIELGPHGIRVNAVLPGVVETEFAADPDALEEELEFVRVQTQSGKIRQPSELGPIYQYLASDASAPVTGALLACDDGLIAGYSRELLGRAFPHEK